jgi:hypothetical protein
MASLGFNVNEPARIYGGTNTAFGGPRPVMGGMSTPGFGDFGPLTLDPNEGPTPLPPQSGGGNSGGGFLGTLQDLLPGLIDAAGAWYGAKNRAGQYDAAANRSVAKPTNIQSLFGGLTYDPTTGITLTPGQGPGPWGGASPELVGAFNQLNDQGAIQGEADTRLSLLRQLAAPEEARATQGLQQQLFSQGRLGGTGGAVQQEALARAQGQADLERTLASQDWARNNALQRFGAANQVIGSGQGQQGINFGQALNLGQLGVQAGRAPAWELLAQGAAGRDAQMQAILGALGGNEEGGLGGILGGLGGIFGGGQQQGGNSSLNLLGQLAGGFGQNVGGNLGAGLGGLSGLLSGLGSKNYGQAAGGLGGILSSIGGAMGGDSKAGGFLGSLGSILGALGGGGAGGSAGGAASALGGLSSLVGGGGNPLSLLSGLGSMGGSGAGALGSLGGAAGSLGGGLAAAAPYAAAIGTALYGIPKLFSALGFGGNMPKGTTAWTAPDGWDTRYWDQWDDDTKSQYLRYQEVLKDPVKKARIDQAAAARSSRLQDSMQFWNQGGQLPSNGLPSAMPTSPQPVAQSSGGGFGGGGTSRSSGYSSGLTNTMVNGQPYYGSIAPLTSAPITSSGMRDTLWG